MSARFANEHPIQSGPPGASLSLTLRGLTAFLRSRPRRAEEATVPRGSLAASGTRRAQAQDRGLGLDLPPRARPDGSAARFPASAARRGLRAQDSRTLPLDV